MNDTQTQLLSMPDDDFIKDYSVASKIVDQAVLSHDKYWKLIQACQEHLGGKKPVPPDELKKKGLGWTWNFNYNKGRAKIEKKSSENIAKVAAALSMGYVTFRNSEPEDEKNNVLSFLLDDNKRSIVASSIGHALYDTLSKESRLSSWLNEIEYPAYAFGYSSMIYDLYDWLPEPIHPLNIAFKPKSKPDNIQQWIIFDVIDAQELYEKWVDAKNESISGDQIASSGWSLKGLEDLLIKAFKGKLKDGKVPAEWGEVIPEFQENASYFIGNTDSISIAKIFHKELNKTITEVYIPWSNTWQIAKPGMPVTTVTGNNIIFKKNHGAYVQNEYINLIRDSGFTAEGVSIQDLRGIATYAVEDSIRYNRLRNGIGNKMQFVGSPMFEQSHSQAGEKFKVTVSQGFILLPASHNLVEKQPAFDISSHVAVLKFEEGEYTRDTQQYDASIQDRLSNRPNKSEVEQVGAEVAQTEGAKNNIKFRDYATLFLTVLKRLPKVQCKETDPGYEGLKRFYSILKKNLSWLIKEDKDVNDILECIDSYVLSPVSQNVETIMIASQMAETPFARNRLKRMLLTAKGLPIEEVNITAPLITDKFANMQDNRVAAFENDMFFTTNEVVVSGTDDHIVHLDSHFSKCARVIKGAQQQALSPIDAFKYLENNLGHCITHIDLLGGNPMYNKLAIEYSNQYKDIARAKDELQKVAEQMMKQQQQQQQQIQLDPETEADIAMKNAKVTSDVQRKDWLASQRTEQRNKQIDLAHEEQLRKIELDAEIKQRQSDEQTNIQS